MLDISTCLLAGAQFVLRGIPDAFVDTAGGVAHRFHHRTRHVLAEYLGVLIVLAALALALVGLGGV